MYQGLGEAYKMRKKYIEGETTVILISAFSLLIAGLLWFFYNHSRESLLGTWENGRGAIFLMVFDEADSIEFLESGTITIVQEDSQRYVDWESDAPGIFIADGEQFSYSISNDILVITDVWDDYWTFDRNRSE